MSNPSSNPTNPIQTDEEREALLRQEELAEADDDGQNDARAEQQMLEGAVDTHESLREIERHRSLEQDEPDDSLNDLDPVPPK